MSAGGDRPFSAACERNREPIGAALATRFADRRAVLEIGSGSGQHAVFLAAAMPWLTWQCTDRADHLPGIALWLADAALPNTPPARELDVARGPWPRPPATVAAFDAAFSANTLHIMAWPQVEAFFAGLDQVLGADAVLAVYGPFNHGGSFSSDSNAAFDGWLKARDPAMGIRDVEAVDALARAIGLSLVADDAMPANNRLLVWRRGTR